jgi:type III secretory pathway lipoprotein EscJ
MGLSLKASRQAAVRAFADELRKANLPPEIIAQLCEMYPDVNLVSALLRERTRGPSNKE